jgi:hypothetical protein
MFISFWSLIHFLNQLNLHILIIFLPPPCFIKYRSRLSQSSFVRQNINARSILNLSIACKQYSPLRIFIASDSVSNHSNKNDRQENFKDQFYLWNHFDNLIYHSNEHHQF